MLVIHSALSKEDVFIYSRFHSKSMAMPNLLIEKYSYTITHKSVEKRASNFLKRAHLDAREMINDFNDLCEIITETNPDKSRTKRFLALLLAISSLSLSLFNSAELLHLHGQISDIVTKQNHIVDILQEHEVSIHQLQHDVLSIRDGFLSHANQEVTVTQVTHL